MMSKPLSELSAPVLNIPPGIEPESLLFERAVAMRLPAATDQLAKLAVMAEIILREVGCSAKESAGIQLSLDEVVANIVMHAYDGRPGNFFQVDFIPMTTGICLVITDRGKSFDFEKAAARYDGKARVDQAVGGIGLFLVKKHIDRVVYSPETPAGNQLVLIKNLKSSPSA